MCKLDLEGPDLCPPKKMLEESALVGNFGTASKVYRIDPQKATYSKYTGNVTMPPSCFEVLLECTQSVWTCIRS